MSGTQWVRLIMKGYDHSALDRSVAIVVETARRTGAVVRGPVPLLRRIQKFTIHRSPHIFNKARDQLEIRTHKRLLEIKASNQETVIALAGLNLPSGIDVQVKYRAQPGSKT
jgi:small subunit ribosomal protein S10